MAKLASTKIVKPAVDPVTQARPEFSSQTDLDSAISPLAIVANIRRGDRPMEAVFFQRYYAGVKRHLARYIHNTSHAEDIAHDALLTVLLRLRNKSIEQPQFLDRFVYQTAKFSYYSWLRRPANQPGLFEPLAEHQNPMDTEQQFLRAEQRRLLLVLIGTLRVERDREILRRAYIHDETKLATCEALALTTSHFDRIIFRARERLKHRLELQDPDFITALKGNLD